MDLSLEFFVVRDGFTQPDGASFHYVLKQLNVDRAGHYFLTAVPRISKRQGMFTVRVSSAAPIEEGIACMRMGFSLRARL